MSIHTLVVTAILFLSLGFDTLGVSIGLGLSGLTRRERWRPAVAFSIAEGIMPLVGFLLGKVVAQAVGEVASYLAVILLLAVGVYTIREAMQEEEISYEIGSLSRLALLALSVSMDELAVGFSLGLLGVPILVAVIYIAAQAFIVTLIGMRLGALLGEVLAERAELVSGLALTGLGLFLLVEKLKGS